LTDLASTKKVGTYPSDNSLMVSSIWNHSRKNFRVSLYDGRFVKLNKFERLSGHMSYSEKRE
jgi:hypothetical protein